MNSEDKALKEWRRELLMEVGERSGVKRQASSSSKSGIAYGRTPTAQDDSIDHNFGLNMD